MKKACFRALGLTALLISSTVASNLSFAATDKLTFTNKIENGKKVWEPATATVKAGDKVEITLVNTLADPHGFEIKDLNQKVVVPGKGTQTLSFDATKPGTYKFDCQLHPAHVGGQLIVK